MRPGNIVAALGALLLLPALCGGVAPALLDARAGAGVVRLFVGLGVEGDLAVALAGVQEELAGAGFDLEPVARENLHLTLHFIGESPASSIPRLVGALEEVAARIPAFELETRGLGCFTRDGGRRIHVVWAGCGEGTDRLDELAGAIDRALARPGRQPDGFPFRPHVTLGRPRDGTSHDALRRWLDERSDRPFGTRSVDRFVLYRSTGEGGRGEPVYRRLHVFSLPGPRPGNPPATRAPGDR